MAANRDIDALYALPLSEFTAARNARVRELRKAKKKEAADELAGLHKPSVSAWAVNQVARRHPERMKELIGAGDAIRKAQRDVLAGKQADVRAATRRQHELADELVSAAREALAADGARVSPALAQRISTTLRGASTDPAAAKLMRQGRLAEDVEPVGFGPLLHVAPARRTSKAPAKPARKQQPSPVQQRRVREARERLQDEERAAKAAARDAERARREAERAAERVAAAERRLAEAEARLRRSGVSR